jgi:hypothetical protein
MSKKIRIILAGMLLLAALAAFSTAFTSPGAAQELKKPCPPCPPQRVVYVPEYVPAYQTVTQQVTQQVTQSVVVTSYSTETQTVTSTPPAQTETATVTATVTDTTAVMFYSILTYVFLALFLASLAILAVVLVLGRTKSAPSNRSR